MLYERHFENMTKGIVQGQAILDTHFPISATKLNLTKLFGFENINKKEILVTNVLFDIRNTSIRVTSWKVVIRSRETGETLWVRAFAHKSEAALVYMRLIGIDIERVGNEPITFPGVWQEGDFEYAFATVQTYTSGTTTWTAPDGVTKTDYLVVAGGGSGGYFLGGGGGAGGYRTATNFSVTPLTGYTVTVGAGGTGGTSTRNNGANSVFSSITSTGGGYGALYNANAANGGSGGGAGLTGTSNGTGTAGQGNDGGPATSSGYSSACAGGGGAGSAGTGGTASSVGGPGGTGSSSSISGSSTTYAGGGGGAINTSVSNVAYTGGSGGSSIGGNGSNSQFGPPYNQATAGATNKGSGGGGGGNTNNYNGYYGGDGGSGIVILSYTPAVIQGNFNSPMLGM